jgi:hypothetical protein
MEYNTQQRTLPLPEYGRSVQNMVDHALTIEDRAERQRCANTIINIMGGMFPHLRDVPDFKHKLWYHFLGINISFFGCCFVAVCADLFIGCYKSFLGLEATNSFK